MPGLQRVDLTDAMREEMINATRNAHPAEACGVVAGAHCYELPNHSEAQGHFRLRAEDIARVAYPHGGYEAVWHSHPSGRPEPSQSDWANHPYGKALVVVAGESVNVYYGEEYDA